MRAESPDRGVTLERGGRLAYIDGLRAIAVLGTVLLHVLEANPGLGGAGPVGAAVRLVLKMGAHGVDLFFVLSGYCLAYPTIERLRAGRPMRFDLTTFWAKRLTRIVPPYDAAIAVSFAILAATGLADPGALDPVGIAKQVVFLDANVVYLNPSFWTLPIELRWYVLFPLALWLYARSPRAFGCLALGLLLLTSSTRVGGIDPGTWPLFLAGIWTADLFVRGVRAGGYALAVGVPSALAATLLEAPLGKQFYAIEPVGMIATVALVVASGALVPLRRVLELPPLVYLGVASYSIYLINDPVVRWTSALGFPPWLTTCAALGASLLFYVACERPVVAGPLRRRLIDALTKALASGVAFLRLPSVIRVEPQHVAAVEPLRRASARSAEAAGVDLRSPAP